MTLRLPLKIPGMLTTPAMCEAKAEAEASICEAEAEAEAKKN